MDQPVITLETSPITAALDEALAKAQGEIETADKDKVNPAFRSKYADLTSVWAACRPALSKNGIALTQWPLSSEDNKLHIITRLAHKGEWMQARFAIPIDKANAHGYGSAITYAKRFTMSAALGIVADDDDDGNAASAGAPGTAGGGTEFRPEKRGAGSMAPARGETTAQNGVAPPPKEKLPAGTGRTATPENARAAKIKAATDKRIKVLKEGPWTPDTLKQFWDTDAEWRAWMTDEDNGASADWERYELAYDVARDLAREAA